MPRRVDYASHFAFAREASFAIVHERGVHHLSRRTVAGQLGVSDGVIRRLVDPDARLEQLAADEMENRRRVGRLFPPRGEPFEVAVSLVMRLAPEEESRVVEELVWLRLVIAAHPEDDALSAHRSRWEQHVESVIGAVLDAPASRALLRWLRCEGALAPEPRNHRSRPGSPPAPLAASSART